MEQSEDKVSVPPKGRDQLEKKQRVNQLEWIVKFVGHVLGSSILILPHAMAQVGIFPFLILLMIELFVTGNSLNLVCEMAPRDEGIEHTNYFSIVEKYLGGHGRLAHYMIRCIFIIDVVICSAFYFKVPDELVFSYYGNTANSRHRSAFRIGIFFILAFILLVYELGGKKSTTSSRSGVQSPHRSGVSPVLNFIECEVNSVTVGNGSKLGPEETRIDMHAVVTRLHGYSSLRLCLLPLLFFLLYSLGEVFWSISNDMEFLELGNSQCAGLLKPFLWTGLNIKSTSALSAIIFSLMHYSIFLPICLEELKLPLQEYAGLVERARIVLLVVLLAITLIVHFTLGESAPVLFITAYGSSVYGMFLTLLALGITLVGMLLRIIGCFRLIQVLFKWESDSHFWIITICVLFVSFGVASVRSILDLVIIAGLMNCNILLIILPRLGYIRFKRTKGEAWMSYDLISTMLCTMLHSLLLMCAVPAMMFAQSYVEENCGKVFDEFWSS